MITAKLISQTGQTLAHITYRGMAITTEIVSAAKQDLELQIGRKRHPVNEFFKFESHAKTAADLDKEEIHVC
jgi:hypothetical protein